MKKRFLALLLVIGALAGVNCTGDLNDVDTCYALAQSFCKKANACDPAYLPSVDGGPNCLSDAYQACTGNQPSKGTFGATNIPNVRSCLDAIDNTACGMSPGNACGALPMLPMAPVPVDSGAPEGGPVDSGTDSTAPMDSTVPQESGPVVDAAGQDSAMGCPAGQMCGTLLAMTGQPGIVELAVSQSQVFWASGSTVYLLSGTIPTPFSSRSVAIQGLAATPMGVAWVENGQAWGQSSGSPTPSQLLAGVSVKQIATEASSLPGWIYGLTAAGSAIVYQRVDGTTPTTDVPTGGGFFSAIGGDPTGTFVAWANASGTIQTASSGSISPQSFGSVPNATSIAVVGGAQAVLALDPSGNAIVAQNGSTTSVGSGISAIAGGGSIGAVLGASGAQITVINAQRTTITVLGAATVLAAGGGNIYWATSTGDIYSYP